MSFSRGVKRSFIVAGIIAMILIFIWCIRSAGPRGVSDDELLAAIIYSGLTFVGIGLLLPRLMFWAVDGFKEGEGEPQPTPKPAEEEEESNKDRIQPPENHLGDGTQTKDWLRTFSLYLAVLVMIIAFITAYNYFYELGKYYMVDKETGLDFSKFQKRPDPKEKKMGLNINPSLLKDKKVLGGIDPSTLDDAPSLGLDFSKLPDQPEKKRTSRLDPSLLDDAPDRPTVSSIPQGSLRVEDFLQSPTLERPTLGLDFSKMPNQPEKSWNLKELIAEFMSPGPQAPKHIKRPPWEVFMGAFLVAGMTFLIIFLGTRITIRQIQWWLIWTKSEFKDEEELNSEP